MTNNAFITIQLPISDLRVIDLAAKDDDLSRAQLIRRILKSHIQANKYAEKYPLPKIAEPSKPTQTAILPPLPDEDTNCIQCGVHVTLSPSSFAAVGKLCKPCREKKFA